MFDHWMRNNRFAVLKGILSAALLIGTTTQAATYPANSTTSCTGPKNCTLESWGIDLNDNTGYSWQVSAAQASAASVYIKAASLSGTRSMSLWVNNTRVATLSINSTTAPRPTGAELSAVSVQLISGNNTIELRDTENTSEFDVHQLRVETAYSSSSSTTVSSSSVSSSRISSSSISSSSISSTPPILALNITNNGGRAYINETVNLSAAVSTGTGWTYSWKLIEDGTYKRTDIHDLTWNSNWDSSCQDSAIGQRITAKLYPPATGQYKFAVAADDMHELYITNNGTKQLLTSSTQAVDDSNFNNQSQLISLNANTAYPFEFLYINNSGSGHFSILWQKPGSSQWEELPEEVFSKTTQTTPTGQLLQETFNQSLGSMSQLKGLTSFINSRSNSGNAVFNGQTPTFTPNQNKTYTFEVTATSGAQTVTSNVSFFAEGRFISEDHQNAASAWVKAGTTDSTLLSLLQLTTVNDGSATGKVLQVTAPTEGTIAKWRQIVYLQPYTAYELRARVRMLNPPNNLVIPADFEDSIAWHLPRVTVGVHGDASQQGIDATAPTTWRDVKVDFIVPFHGAVDVNLEMAKIVEDKRVNSYPGTFQIDNLQLVKLTGNGVTRFDFPNLSANIYDDLVTKTGGYEATKNYFLRVSKSAENMRQLSGKNYVAQCRKENIFVPRNWHVFALGTNYNGMVLKTQNLLTNEFLKEVWGSSNIVGGVMVHEVEHTFEHGPFKFGTHMTDLLQAYAMETNNYLRTHNNRFLNVQEWMQEERNTLSICSTNPGALRPKLFEFQNLLQNKWAPFKQIMHDQWSPYKTEVEGRVWPWHPYQQYRMWWTQLESYTGIDGWNLLHTAEEKALVEISLGRNATPIKADQPPSTYTASESTLYLHRAEPVIASVGFGKLDINDLVPIANQCYLQNIYAHAPSTLSYDLNKKWLAFNTKAAIKDNSLTGQVIARIRGDGNTLYQSSSFTAQTSPVDPGTIDVSNVNQLTIEFLDGGSNDSDWSVWLDPLLSRSTTAAAKFASAGKAIKHSSGKCIAPEFGGNPAMNEKAVLSDDCTSSNSKFKWLASGALMHINSGACLHPYNGSSTPSNGTYWVFFPNCENFGHIQYDPTSQNSIKHRTSTSCIHPEGGSGTPATGTKLVFDQGCDETRLAFTLQ